MALKARFKYEGKSEARSTEQTSPGRATSAKGVKNSVLLQTYIYTGQELLRRLSCTTETSLPLSNFNRRAPAKSERVLGM